MAAKSSLSVQPSLPYLPPTAIYVAAKKATGPSLTYLGSPMDC